MAHFRMRFNLRYGTSRFPLWSIALVANLSRRPADGVSGVRGAPHLDRAFDLTIWLDSRPMKMSASGAGPGRVFSASFIGRKSLRYWGWFDLHRQPTHRCGSFWNTTKRISSNIDTSRIVLRKQAPRAGPPHAGVAERKHQQASMIIRRRTRRGRVPRRRTRLQTPGRNSMGSLE